LIETGRKKEKTVLVLFAEKQKRKTHNYPGLSGQVTETLHELKFLAETAGAIVMKAFFQEKEKIDSRYMIGKGKAQEISDYVDLNEISLVIFENELSFTQLRNLEQLIKCKVIDKSTLILDIFAKNAKTSQSKLQVELAQLEYLLPRLTRQWTHLSKQYGGIGTKGPGETQIETDRRLIKKRISVLKEKLKKIDNQRKTQSQERKNFIRISLIGYTNAGKSTLLNILTDSNVYVEDKLFATLDTSTRLLNLPSDTGEKTLSRYPKKVLISDTVGFIKNLPHDLIESFRSTLAEAVESDILLNIIDVSNPNYEEHTEVVNETLKEIGAENKFIINVFNKIDKLENSEILKDIKEKFENSVFISAAKGINISSLLDMIAGRIKKEHSEKFINLEPDDYKRLSYLFETTEVKEVKYLKKGIKIKISN